MNLSISNPHPRDLNKTQKLGLSIVAIGLLLLFFSFIDVSAKIPYGLPICLLSLTFGTVIYSVGLYKNETKGIKNNKVWFDTLSNRGVWAWMAGIAITAFYVFLYWFPAYLGLNANGANTGIVGFFDPLSRLFSGRPASQWFVYGTLYSLCILSLGIKFMLKYRGNRYHQIRTIAVIISQLLLAYFIPEILEALNPNTAEVYFDKDIKNIWPLNYDFFAAWQLDNMQASANQPYGMIYLIVGIGMFLIGTPLITYFYGKRWYCSWICGCGGLAETAGDSFRHLSSKKLSAWKLERWLIHSVMVFVFIMTFASLYSYFTGSSTFLGLDVYKYYTRPYGFVIGAMFSGVVGVGFYPLLGNRVWCRFGCPMAGYMGIIQRFKSRFRITTNGGQCISCGNCSTYCEQGIDVRWYAQRGQNVVRASCVGCGVCSSVCPRGVLKLENGPEEGRINDNPILLGDKDARLNTEVK